MTYNRADDDTLARAEMALDAQLAAMRQVRKLFASKGYDKDVNDRANMGAFVESALYAFPPISADRLADMLAVAMVRLLDA